MKKITQFLLVGLLSLLSVGLKAQTTETFESANVGSSSFTSNGNTFTLLPNAQFVVENYSLYGYLSSSQYIDNLGNTGAPLYISSATPFTLKSMYVYPSTYATGNYNQTSGTNITFIGILAGTTQFSYTPASTDFANALWSNTTNRGFSLVDFSTPGYQNTPIDNLEIICGGSTIYAAVDNFTWALVTPPAVTSVAVPSNGTYKLGSTLDFTVNFDQSVIVTGTPCIPVTLNTGGTVNATYISGSGANSLAFRYTVASGNLDADGVAVSSAIVLNGGTIKNGTLAAALTLNSVASTTGVLVDGVAPTVSITSTTTSTTNTTPIPVTVTFSESVSNFISTDVTITNGTINSFAGSGTTYTFTVTPTAQGTVTVAIASSVATDAAGNGNTAATSLTRTFDNIAPTVVISSTAANPTNLTAIPVTVTFSESVSNFISTDVTVTNGTINSFAGSGTTYTFTVTPTAQGTVTVAIAGSVATDAAGNNNTAATSLTRTYTISTSVADANQTAKVSVYPNPTSDVIHLSTTEGIESISITNLAGSVVWNGATSAFPLNVSTFAKGVYLVNILSADGVKTEKVIIK
jgi:hypothetical protein